jgi:hypothetical protein
MLHAQEYRDPAARNAMMATALKGSEQEAELLKQRGMDEAVTQAAAAKGAAQVQAEQAKQAGADARADKNNKAALARVDANNAGALARLQAKPVPPQRPLTLLGPEGESAYAVGKDGATLIPMTVQGQVPAPAASAPKFIAGKIYIDGNGNKARYSDKGTWDPVT